MPRLTSLLATLVLSLSAIAADPASFQDSFTDPALKARRAGRGPWKFADSTATCTQDDALYAKFKNHGPILFYDVPFTDSVMQFRFKPDAAVKSVVFTANAEKGHVFRFVANAKGTSLRAFKADHSSVMLASDGPALKPGEWTDVEVSLKGTEAIVKIGSSYTKAITHPDLAQAKTNFSIGYSFGTLSVQSVSLQK
jgi:hypothetical protein